jgi:two-component system CheB/CheR fusion protein
VKLFTPLAREIFNLIAVDVGRPLLDITTTMNVPDLRADVERVLETLHTREREVETEKGRWYLMRLLPYRTAEDRIEGVVMIFFDITERRAAEQRLAASEERLRLLIDSAVDYAIFTVTSENIVDSWNSGAERMFGYTEDQIVGRSAVVLFTDEDQKAGVPGEEMRRAAADGRAVDERWHVRKDRTRLYCSGVMTPLRETGLFAKIARDLTEQRNADEGRRRVHLDLESRVAERTAALQTEVTVRRQAEERASALVRQLVSVQEDERRRIARDIHDQLGQQFTAMRLNLDAHRARCAAVDDFDKVMSTADQIDASIEFIAWQLRPAVLDDLGLPAALRQYVREWSSQTGIRASFNAETLAGGRLPAESETHLYRIAQEALNNILRHAGASSVDVVLGSRDGSVVLVVEDDGAGFDTAAVSGTGLGISGMRERANLCGGTVEVESRPGGGTSVFATLPLTAREH